MDVILPNCMSNVTLFLFFTPLSIQTMKLTCNVSMLYQVICLLEISYFKSLQKDIFLQLPTMAKNSLDFYHSRQPVQKQRKNIIISFDYSPQSSDLVNLTKSSFAKKIQKGVSAIQNGKVVKTRTILISYPFHLTYKPSLLQFIAISLTQYNFFFL